MSPRIQASALARIASGWTTIRVTEFRQVKSLTGACLIDTVKGHPRFSPTG